MGVPLGTTRAKNSFLWASCFRKITNDVTAAFEWSYWDFQTVSFVNHVPMREVKGQSGTAHAINISLSYQF